MMWQKPQVGELVKHDHSPILYEIVMLTNEHSINLQDSPVTVVYRDLKSQRNWSMPMRDFVRMHNKVTSAPKKAPHA